MKIFTFVNRIIDAMTCLMLCRSFHFHALEISFDENAFIVHRELCMMGIRIEDQQPSSSYRHLLTSQPSKGPFLYHLPLLYILNAHHTSYIAFSLVNSSSHTTILL